jgi:hypothetical protein
MGELWSLMTVLGPIILGLALIWAIMRNRRQRNTRSEAQSDAGTRDLYNQLDREDRQGGSG